MSEDLPVTRAALHAAFGPNAFELPCFYVNEPALRFELSLGGDWLDQFEQAWDRARPILDHALGDAREVVVVVSRFTGGTPLQHRDLFQSLRACKVRMGRPRAWWTEPFHDEYLEEPEERFFVAFACARTAVHRLLWGALAGDLSIRPRLDGMLYIADPARGILVHPYDDRGMDVIGPNRALLAEMYHRFNDRLLDYDRARMDASFASAGSASPPG